MGDNVYDDGGKDGELSCEITRLSSTETTESLPNVCGVCKRSKSMKIGLLVSFLVNLVFMVLFVVVFIMLNDLNTRLSHYDDTLDRMNAKFTQNEGEIDGQVGNTVVSKSSSRPPETVIPAFVVHEGKMSHILRTFTQSEYVITRKITFTTQRLLFIIFNIYHLHSLPLNGKVRERQYEL